MLTLISVVALQAQTTPSTQNTDFAYAEKLAQDGYVELAIAQYQQFLQRFPGDQRVPEALRKIAEAQFSMEYFAAARKSYEKLLLQHGASSYAQDAIFRIGECFAREETFTQAAQSFERFAVLNESLPLAAKAYLQAGAMYLQASERVKGRSLLYKVIENYRGMEEAQAEANLLLLQDFVAAGEYHRAFDLANAFLAKFSEITATPKVWLIKARLHTKLGQVSKALDTLESIRSKYKDTETARRAMLPLAELYFKLGERDNAHGILAQLPRAANDSLTAEAAFLHTRLYLEENRFADALTAIQSLEVPRGHRIEKDLLVGKIYFSLEDYSKALDSFEHALQNVAADNDSLQCVVLYNAAQAAFELGNGAKANDYIRSMRQNSILPAIRGDVDLLQADVLFERYEDAARASRKYAAFIENNPEHHKVDDAQAKLAQCYESLKQWNLAGAEWQRLLQSYPASPHIALAKNHLELIEKYFTPDYVTLVENMVGKSGLNGAQFDPMLRQAELHFRFHNYQKAIPLLKQVIGVENVAGARARGMYLLGSTYYALGDIAYLEKRSETSAWFDSAAVVLQHVRSRYGDAFDAPELDVKLGLLALRNGKASLSELDSLSMAHKNDLNYAQIHNYVLPAQLATAVQGDSSAQATYLNRLFTLSSLPNNTDRNKANLTVARFALIKQDTATTLLNLEKIIKDDARDPDRVEAELLFARLLGGSGRMREAMQMLNSLRRKYFYSVYTDSVLFYLASFSYQLEKYQDAIDFLQELRARRAAITGRNKNALWAEAQYLLAQTYEKSGKELVATGAYLSFLQSGPDDARASGTLLALGRIAEKLHAIPLAKDYYSDVPRLYADHIENVRQAKIHLADLEFRLGNYKAARTFALDILQANPPREDEMALTKLAIIAKLRQNILQNTESEIKNFKSKFDDDNEAYAEIQFELGDYYIRQKNFKRAGK
ncbi:MAG: tetratricopeptide repeat protein, partial [bacterium]